MITKAWGCYERLYLDEKYDLRLLHIDRGGYCSLHWHRTKSNVFDVVAGTLLVRAFPSLEPVGEPVVYTLEPKSRALSLPSRELHQFMGLTDVVLYEGSAADPGEVMEPDEIHRLTESGKCGCENGPCKCAASIIWPE